MTNFQRKLIIKAFIINILLLIICITANEIITNKNNPDLIYLIGKQLLTSAEEIIELSVVCGIVLIIISIICI